MRPWQTTYEDEVARHGRLIALVDRRPPIRKLQRAVDSIAELWSPPDHRFHSLGGRVHWRVRPTRDAVAVVARHCDDPRVGLRHAVIAALVHASPHGDVGSAAIARGLAEDDIRLRILAARAAASLALGDALAHLLAPRLVDPIWTVRWHAAAALARTAHRDAAIAALLRSEPRVQEFGGDHWTDCARAFADEPAVMQRVAAHR